jgi:hypothetical protein
MRAATLISWALTACLGLFMLRTWLARGGLGRERAREGGLPPQLIFGHASAAIVGLAVWAGFVASGARPLAWTAVALLMVAIGLGLCTVTLWTPYPARKPGERRDTGGTAPVSVRAVGAEPAGAEPASAALAGEVTDEMIARFLADPEAVHRARLIRPDPAVLVPVAHGFAAIATFMLAVVSAIT